MSRVVRSAAGRCARGVVEGDLAAGALGLAACLVDLVADGNEPPVEVQTLLGEVDVGPLEAEHLVAAHPSLAVSQ
jgi:hypothetical protein